MNQWELKANTCDRHQARENACDQVAIGWVGGASFFKPITERSKANQKIFKNHTNKWTILLYYSVLPSCPRWYICGQLTIHRTK